MGLKIAHRGLWNEVYPENSLGSFKRSISKDIPIELDVHILKDDTLIVFHDDNLKRMTGLNKNVKDCTYSDVKDLTLKKSGEKIPIFKEVLDLVKGKVLLDIEIKTDVRSRKICKLVAEELDNYNGDFLIKSFSPIYINWFKKNRPTFKRGLLVSNSSEFKKKNLTRFCLSSFCIKHYCKPQFLAINKKLLSHKRIKSIREDGIKILIWTITDDKWYDADGIIFEKNRK